MTQRKPTDQNNGPARPWEESSSINWLHFLQDLQEISSALLNKQDPDAVLAMVAERAAKLVSAETAAVGLIDWETRQVTYVHGYGKLTKRLVGAHFKLDGSSRGWTAATGQSAVFNDLPNDERADNQEVEDLGIHSSIQAPLKLENQVIGVLTAYNRLDGQPFDEADQGLFTTLANHAAVAIGNAQLYARTRSALQKADTEKSKLEAVLNNLGDGVVVCDAHGRIIMANEAAEVMTGLRARNAIGREPSSLLPKMYAAEIAAAFKGLANSKREDGMFRELTATLRNGKTIRVDIHPVFGTDGSFFGTAAVLQDITKAVQIDRAKTEFISVVAHELRTPLTALKGSIGLVLGGAAGDIDQTLGDLLNIAQNNCNRLIRLVDDMLDTAKIEADRFSLRLDVATLQECVRRVVCQMQQFADEQSVRLTVKVSGKPSLVVIDRDRIEQVVTNLLSNAIKFAPPGSEVLVAVKRIHGCVRVSVTDSGPGIPREDHQRVFEKFYQGAYNRRNGGSGLGLAISKTIVEQHGGKIYVKSTPGQGCTFAFLIPVPGEEALMTVRD